MGVASLVLGIISIVFCFIPGISIIGIVTGLVAIILGVMAKKDEAEKSKATAGLIMGIIGLSLSIIIWVSCVVCANKIVSESRNALERAGYTEENINKVADALKKIGDAMPTNQ